ncbi:MAG: hypothetical protein QOH16_2941 [Gaiellaceae bacterium]|nr:hypothetical protein [Gaiellaceae bacterium]
MEDRRCDRIGEQSGTADALTFGELLQAVHVRSDEAGFLGSDDHLKLMRDYVLERDHRLNVEWVDGQSFYEPGADLIGLERPPGNLRASEAGELVALVLNHEVAHARFTDQQAFRDFLLGLPAIARHPSHHGWINSTFNFLEDARLAVAIGRLEPDAAQHLSRLNARAVDAYVLEYERENRASPWVANPPSPPKQSEVAVIEQILVGNKPRVHPDVDALRERIQGRVDRARRGGTTDAADAAEAIYALSVGALA